MHAQHIDALLSGQGCQVPPDSHRKQDPQAGPLLQDQESTGPQLEVVRTDSTRFFFPTPFDEFKNSPFMSWDYNEPFHMG